MDQFLLVLTIFVYTLCLSNQTCCLLKKTTRGIVRLALPLHICNISDVKLTTHGVLMKNGKIKENNEMIKTLKPNGLGKADWFSAPKYQ